MILYIFRTEANDITAPLAAGPHTQIFGDSFGQSEPTFDPMCSAKMFSRIQLYLYGVCYSHDCLYDPRTNNRKHFLLTGSSLEQGPDRGGGGSC